MRYHRIDVVVALSIAGLVNLDDGLHRRVGVRRAPTCWTATASSAPTASWAGWSAGERPSPSRSRCSRPGLSSSSVGTYAGQVVMQGFIRRRIPLFLRRAVTMLPALLILATGLPVTASLVVSQVVLSFGIPFALVPLAMRHERGAT